MKIMHINEEAGKRAYEAVSSGIDYVMQGVSKKWPLFKCSAYVKTDGVDWVLVSYSTPIALYTPGDGTVWDCLRIKYGYTATSNQHIYKFIKWLEQHNLPVHDFVRFTK